MRRATPKASGLYVQLVDKFLTGRPTYRWCRHLPRCPVGTPFEECPHPSNVAVALAAGEPVDVAAWQLPGRVADYGLDMYERVRVHPDGSLGPASPLTGDAGRLAAR